jgi:hypothetical protein
VAFSIRIFASAGDCFRRESKQIINYLIPQTCWKLIVLPVPVWCNCGSVHSEASEVAFHPTSGLKFSLASTQWGLEYHKSGMHVAHRLQVWKWWQIQLLSFNLSLPSTIRRKDKYLISLLMSRRLRFRISPSKRNFSWNSFGIFKFSKSDQQISWCSHVRLGDALEELERASRPIRIIKSCVLSQFMIT